MTRQKREKKRAKSTGTLPGESRRRSLITVQRQTLSMSGERAKATDEDHFVLTTHMLDREWTYTIQVNGERWVIPGAVADRMRAHRDAIITEQRKLRATERFAKVAEQDQAEAEDEAAEQRAAGL